MYWCKYVRNFFLKILLQTMHKCRNYKLNLWPFYHLTFKCDLDLLPTQTYVSNGTTTPQWEQLCKIILQSMHKCRSYGPDKLNLCPFYHFTFRCDLDLQSTWTNVLNGTSTPQGEQLCHIILKSMHKYRSYGQDKLNLWPLQEWLLPSTYLKSVSNGSSPPQGQQLCQIILKSMNKCRSYGTDKSQQTDPRMHAHTPNKNCKNNVLLYRKRVWLKLFLFPLVLIINFFFTKIWSLTAENHKINSKPAMERWEKKHLGISKT